MNKQEEIREGIKNLIDKNTHFYKGNYSPLAGTLTSSRREMWCKPSYLADEIFSYLHSQGVVIKVEKELPHKMPAVPNNEWSAGYSCGEESMQDIMVEWHNDSLLPLIEEKE